MEFVLHFYFYIKRQLSGNHCRSGLHNDVFSHDTDHSRHAYGIFSCRNICCGRSRSRHACGIFSCKSICCVHSRSHHACGIFFCESICRDHGPHNRRISFCNIPFCYHLLLSLSLSVYEKERNVHGCLSYIKRFFKKCAYVCSLNFIPKNIWCTSKNNYTSEMLGLLKHLPADSSLDSP